MALLEANQMCVAFGELLNLGVLIADGSPAQVRKNKAVQDAYLGS
ncbi:MAG: hypothetical protein Q8K63_00695 [Acidimicrobiales bacterium]|nr:hypothetical protein [Acidimicrobiales bacterium]